MGGMDDGEVVVRRVAKTLRPQDDTTTRLHVAAPVFLGAGRCID